MISFSKRSKELEMMDGETNPIILRQNYAEIERVNQYLGGHATLLRGLSLLTKEKRIYSVLDVGCGSGDAIVAMLNWAKKRGLKLRITGLDYSETACNMAKKCFQGISNVEIVCSDYREYNPTKNIDIVCSNLFNHHLTDEQNRDYLKWADDLAKTGIIINDLHRHPIAYYFIKFVAKLANTSAYFRNDAPLSVLRAFKNRDLKQFRKDTNLNLKIRWCWAFRWLIWTQK